jgi:hypothetical protein
MIDQMNGFGSFIVASPCRPMLDILRRRVKVLLMGSKRVTDLLEQISDIIGERLEEEVVLSRLHRAVVQIQSEKNQHIFCQSKGKGLWGRGLLRGGGLRGLRAFFLLLIKDLQISIKIMDREEQRREVKSKREREKLTGSQLCERNCGIVC